MCFNRKFYLSGSNLHFGISDPLLVMLFIGTLPAKYSFAEKINLEKSRNPKKLIWGLSKEMEEHHQIDNPAHSGNILDCVAFVHETI